MSRRGAGTAAVLTGEGARCAVSTQALSSRELQALHELTLAAVTARRRLPAPGACPRVGRRVCRIQSLTLVTVNCELCLASPVAYYCPPVFGPKKKEKRIFVILRSYDYLLTSRRCRRRRKCPSFGNKKKREGSSPPLSETPASMLRHPAAQRMLQPEQGTFS